MTMDLSILSSLIQTILTKIPYDYYGGATEHESGHVTLETLAYQLIHTMADMLKISQNYSSNDNKKEYNIYKHFVNAWIECLGGRTTPQGHVTKMSSPLRKWLDDSIKSGTNNFIPFLLDTIQKGDIEPPILLDHTRFLIALLQNYPNVILAHERYWNHFQ
jgi:hypothetical protein